MSCEFDEDDLDERAPIVGKEKRKTPELFSERAHYQKNEQSVKNYMLCTGCDVVIPKDLKEKDLTPGSGTLEEESVVNLKHAQ